MKKQDPKMTRDGNSEGDIKPGSCFSATLTLELRTGILGVFLLGTHVHGDLVFGGAGNGLLQALQGEKEDDVSFIGDG